MEIIVKLLLQLRAWNNLMCVQYSRTIEQSIAYSVYIFRESKTVIILSQMLVHTFSNSNASSALSCKIFASFSWSCRF